MTKSKKILCIALALLMIAGAVFFAVYNKVGKKYDFGKIKDYSKYITIGEVEGLSFSADDSEIEKPDADDVDEKIASVLRNYFKTYPTDDDAENVKVTDPAAVIGDYDVVYVNFYGTYVGEGDKLVYFVTGSRMDKDAPVALYVKSGAKSELFANDLKGKSPNPGDYTLKATGAEGDDSVIGATDVVYITYTWERYKYAEDGVTPDEDTKETNTSVDSTLVTNEFRLDLNDVPDYFPAGFAQKIIDKGTAGKIDAENLVFDNVEVALDEGPVNFQYKYQVTINRVIGTFNFIEFDYTFADDATDKDAYGNDLKGKAVKFYAVISYFNDAPDLTATYPASDEEGAEEISIILADDKINFDNTSYYAEKDVKSESDWLALEENAGKTKADYNAYLAEQYTAYIQDDLNHSYEDEREKAAAKPMWEKLNEQITAVDPPKRAVKLAKNDLLSQFKYVFNNSTFENAQGKTVSYRTQYGSFKKFMAACYSDADVMGALGLDANAAYKKAVEDGKSYNECLDAAVNEIVTTKLLIYALYDKFGDEVKIDEANFEYQRSMMYMYYYYGLSNSILPDSALRESMMFDSVMQYVYDHANVQWESDGANP
ncbi:MAG: hypothetical protein J6X72_00095 [Clostridia bacterium]|nr:hypothetical protein [Clostridia bacterium]